MKDFQANEKRTFRLYTVYSSIEGIILGILALNEFVFLKSLQGTNYQMSLLFQFSVVVFVGLFFIHEWLKRVVNRKALLRRTALLTRIPMLGFLLFPSQIEAYQHTQLFHALFLLVFFIYYLGHLVINPTINFLLKANYFHQNFGKLYSYSATVNKIIMLVTTFVYGWLLDLHQMSFTWVLPLAGLLSIVSLWVLSLIHYPETGLLPGTNLSASVQASVRDMVQIVVKNKAFRDFEIGFMFYGFSFMIAVTVITVYFYEGLNMNYSSVAFYRNSYNIIAIALLPLAGRMLGKLDPRLFSAITYGSVMAYIIFLGLTVIFPQHSYILGVKFYYVLIFYIIAHGVFAATMVLLWNIGSAYFCAPDDAGSYQSVHLFLTGFRSLFAPAAGVFFYEQYGLITTFTIASASLLIAILINIWSYWRKRPIVQ
jgi:hypothetical protein